MLFKPRGKPSSPEPLVSPLSTISDDARHLRVPAPSLYYLHFRQKQCARQERRDALEMQLAQARSAAHAAATRLMGLDTPASQTVASYTELIDQGARNERR